MKKYLIIAAIALFVGSIFAQDGQWINKIIFQPTNNCPDSNLCYQDVVIEINLNMIPDSTRMWVKIGTTYGADDIYSRHVINTSDLHNQQGVSEPEANVLRFTLGSYIIPDENFFVNLVFE